MNKRADLLATFKGHNDSVNCAQFLPDLNFPKSSPEKMKVSVISGGLDSFLMRWEISGNVVYFFVKQHNEQ